MTRDAQIQRICTLLMRADDITLDAVGNVVQKLIEGDNKPHGLKIMDLFTSLF